MLPDNDVSLGGANPPPLGFPSSSYTFPVEISYLTFCGFPPNLSSVSVLLFSFGVVLLLFEVVNDPGFSGVQFVKFGWLIVAAVKYLEYFHIYDIFCLLCQKLVKYNTQCFKISFALPF